MVFFGRVVRLAVDYLPQAIISRLPFLLLVVAFLVVRRRALERRILGRCRTGFCRELALTTVTGIAAGLVGTLLLLYLGVTIDTQGFYYVLLGAVLLMLLDLRYLCLAYAGGLLSLISLATGAPRLHIPGLLALVAVLHLTESALIVAGGDQQAVPVYLRRPGGTVGGFLLQQAWPIPLLVLTVVLFKASGRLTSPGQPGWWPLIPWRLADPSGITLQLVPAAAALGYSDLSLTATPRVKAAKTAGLLGLYSIVLFALAVAAGRLPLFAWVAALFAPAGHELVLYVARRAELRGEPAFAQTPLGVRILAVLPGSRAEAAGLASGHLISKLDGEEIHSRAEFHVHAGDTIHTTITVRESDGAERPYVLRGDARSLGLILAPDRDDPAQIDVKPWRLLPRWKALP